MNPVTILLASDDAHRTIYTMLLQEAGFRVVEATSSREVERIAQSEKAAAVIVDLRDVGPEDGPARSLHAELGASIPVVVLSQSASLAIDRKRKRATLPKPCHPRDVLRTLTALLGTSDRASRRARVALDRLPTSEPPAPADPGDDPRDRSAWQTEEMRRLWEGLRSD